MAFADHLKRQARGQTPQRLDDLREEGKRWEARMRLLLGDSRQSIAEARSLLDDARAILLEIRRDVRAIKTKVGA